MSKIYCWNGKTRNSQFGDFYTLNLKMEELEKYANKGYINVVVNKRRESDQYWNDLAITISQFKPKAKEDNSAVRNNKAEDKFEDLNVPF